MAGDDIKKESVVEDIDAMIESLSVLVAVRDGIPYRKRLDGAIKWLRTIIDKTDGNK